uniref:OBG-type G domain-containing protein n=1 Tax=Cafeteria roenbergensis TaxID=33653 RepID=A0A7S0K4Z1_CAFRO
MSTEEKIKDIEAEMAKTQKNKATAKHLGLLKAKLAKLKTELVSGGKGGGGGAGEGFDVSKSGDTRVGLVGFPSVGKSTLLSQLTGTESLAAAYEFTTLTCVPGNLYHKGCRIQLLDLPGIIEGASEGKGRGREVIAVARSSDLVMMVLDAGKEGAKNHRGILEKELEKVGLRLNKSPPDIVLKMRKTGGIKFASTVPLTRLGDDPERTVTNILREFRVSSATILIREDVSVDDVIDVIEGNRTYVRCIYVYSKIDTVSIEDVDHLARLPNSLVCSVYKDLGFPDILETMWSYLGLCRIYTKKKGSPPDLKDPVVLTQGRGGRNIEAFCRQIHSSLLTDFNYALVWGKSAKHSPQHCGLKHALHDEDVVQIVTRTVAQQKADAAGYAARAQAAYDEYKAKKKIKAKGLRS